MVPNRYSAVILAVAAFWITIPTLAKPTYQDLQARHPVEDCGEILEALHATSFCSSFLGYHDASSTTIISPPISTITTTISPSICTSTESPSVVVSTILSTQSGNLVIVSTNQPGSTFTNTLTLSAIIDTVVQTNSVEVDITVTTSEPTPIETDTISAVTTVFVQTSSKISKHHKFQVSNWIPSFDFRSDFVRNYEF
jgi:hypothetical protein